MVLDLAELEQRARLSESRTMPGTYWAVLVTGAELLELVRRVREREGGAK